MFDKFTVKQEHGKDSTIEVYQETIQDFPQDELSLRFLSDQSLTSNSDRAWNVEKAIKDYAHPLGYECSNLRSSKNELVFIYSPEAHSRSASFKIQQQIKHSDEYLTATGAALQECNTTNRKYGTAIRQLKNLVQQLEKKNDAELDTIKQQLIETQVSLMDEIPEQVSEFDKERLLNPKYPYTKIEMDFYSDYGQEGVIPDSLDWILELL